METWTGMLKFGKAFTESRQKLLNKLSVEYLLLTTCQLPLLDFIEAVLEC